MRVVAHDVLFCVVVAHVVVGHDVVVFRVVVHGVVCCSWNAVVSCARIQGTISMKNTVYL